MSRIDLRKHFALGIWQRVILNNLEKFDCCQLPYFFTKLSNLEVLELRDRHSNNLVVLTTSLCYIPSKKFRSLKISNLKEIVEFSEIEDLALEISKLS
jgi:hypothetical protein